MVQVPKVVRTLSSWRPSRPTWRPGRPSWHFHRPSRPTVIKWTRISAVVLTGLAGGYIGLALGGHVETQIGPTNTALSLHPSWTGGTTIQIPPLGALHLDTHWGPISLNASVSELREAEARKLIQDDNAVDHLTTQIGGQLRHGMIIMILRAVGLALAFSFLAALAIFRSWRQALISLGSATAGLVALSALAYWTFNPQAIAEPRYTGLLANAPQVVGDTRNLVERFTAYRAQLARQVVNLSKLYAATSTLPTYEPDPSTLRVLHVSDIHINPAAWNVIRSVTNQFQADMIIDTGDISDHGSAPEDKFVNDISSLKVPYVYVRGNHDSKATQKAVARQKNAIVLDNQLREVDGLRIYGVGDPRFTPDKSTRDDNVGNDQLHALGAEQAARLRLSGTAPDLVAVHDPAQAQGFSGLTSLLLSGHLHERSTKLLPTGTRLFVQGSTGGAGLRGLEHEEPTPIELSVLYFSRATHRLQGWDDLRLGGLGLTSAQIERHLEPKPDRAITADNTPTPNPTSPSPTFPSLPPSQWPSTSPSPTRTSSPG
ncbi:metallophosphoesterase [Actinomadura barringtoniae]|uniref:Metallophosphoesterase n=1 Tax=Actinomadura barringtoniae TaxID=1427535 RepID=A0A939TC55_9ACTN|nr:metallophosphoesterase [Actinomadura barringtoniae]MBO2454207.1 metallophosphoesterase [Actinomadura barringtoniae]